MLFETAPQSSKHLPAEELQKPHCDTPCTASHCRWDSQRLADEILRKNIEILQRIAKELLKYETIDADQIDDIMAGATPREPKGWSDDTPKGKSKKKTSIKGAAEEL